MTDLLAARSQMAMSLGFHIIFAVVGMAMPLLMVLAEWRWLRRGEAESLELARRWAKGTAVMFAVGAVSGTVLSFELGLLWPEFMKHAGPVVGMPFSLEGFAFFLEAIFLGLYLYGWTRLSARMHLFAGVMVFISGTFSAVFVVTANAWMNTPAGFRFEDGQFRDIDPFAAMLNPAAPTQVLHMTLAAWQAVAFAVAGIHAYMLLREQRERGETSAFHRIALTLALCIAIPTAFLQPISGDLSAKHVAEHQPVKLAALEGHFDTERRAPLRIGGWPDEATATTPYAIEIPMMLSVLSFGDPDAEVRGLKDFPREDWPPVAVTHFAFQIMVGAGTAMMAVAALALLLAWRRRRSGEGGPPLQPWFLKLLVIASPLGIIAIEAGWTVTEVGRQPWVIHGIMRTKDAVTPMPGLWVPFTLFSLLYLMLGVIVVVLLRRVVLQSGDMPTGPQSPSPAAPAAQAQSHVA